MLKLKCFEIEENEYKLNLLCEMKFVAILHSFKSDVPYSKELVAAMAGEEFSSVCDDLTMEILLNHKDKVF